MKREMKCGACWCGEAEEPIAGAMLLGAENQAEKISCLFPFRKPSLLIGENYPGASWEQETEDRPAIKNGA